MKADLYHAEAFRRNDMFLLQGYDWKKGGLDKYLERNWQSVEAFQNFKRDIYFSPEINLNLFLKEFQNDQKREQLHRNFPALMFVSCLFSRKKFASNFDIFILLRRREEIETFSTRTLMHSINEIAKTFANAPTIESFDYLVKWSALRETSPLSRNFCVE